MLLSSVFSTVHIDMVLGSRARSLHSQSKLSCGDVGECWSLVGEETKSGTYDAVRMTSFQVAVDESGRSSTGFLHLSKRRMRSVHNQGHTYRESGSRVSTYGYSLLREAVWYGMANKTWSFR